MTKRQPKQSHLWVNEAPRVRLRPDQKDRVWSYDLLLARASDDRPFRILRSCMNIPWSVWP